VTHVIPAERLTEQYMSRLVVSNIVSTAEIDRKWSPRFGVPIFDFLRRSQVDNALRCLYFSLLAPISANSRRFQRRAGSNARRGKRSTGWGPINAGTPSRRRVRPRLPGAAGRLFRS
jgi:hypothetical protein